VVRRDVQHADLSGFIRCVVVAGRSPRHDADDAIAIEGDRDAGVRILIEHRPPPPGLLLYGEAGEVLTREDAGVGPAPRIVLHRHEGDDVLPRRDADRDRHAGQSAACSRGWSNPKV
jgi:hypothetical protein